MLWGVCGRRGGVVCSLMLLFGGACRNFTISRAVAFTTAVYVVDAYER